MPIFYECQRCAACCRWPGQVRLTAGEITRLAAFQGLGEPEFIQQFTRLTADRHGLALLDQTDGACIFLQDDRCAVQSVKPQQCRDFPNLWRNPDTVQFCRAVPREANAAEYVCLLAAATGRSEAEVTGLICSQIAVRPGAT